MNKPSLAIRCEQLTKTYQGKPPVEAVRGVDLQVHAGECFGVLGPNGAGKTTTIEILEGLLPPTSGSVRVLDMQWRTHELEIRQRIGVSLQETQLSDRLTVAETIALFRSFYRNGLTTVESLKRVALTEKAGAWIKKPCQVAKNSDWQLPWRLWVIPTCFSWMNRPPVWIPAVAGNFGILFGLFVIATKP